MKAIRKQSSLKILFPAFLLLARAALSADDLADASEYEKEGKTVEARTAYLRWLGQDTNRSSLSYGRTLLHVLRMGGEGSELLNLLDSCLPGVSDSRDRRELLKFGAYLADMLGQGRRAQTYISRFNAEDKGLLGWMTEYYALQEGSEIIPKDPLVYSSDDIDTSRIKNEALLYLLYLNRSREESSVDWIGEAVDQFPFLMQYPEWLFIAWFCCSDESDAERASYYRSELLKRYPDSPETGILKGRAQLYYTPVFVRLLPEENGDGGISYLQAGAFGRFDNAQELKSEISEKTGLNVEIIHTGSVYKVIIPTDNPEQDQLLLKRLGYDSFRGPQSVPNR